VNSGTPKPTPRSGPGAPPILIFEGTYTREFSNNPQRTPHYDYNPILYRLDLDAPALAPAPRGASPR
jgi:hypothetical protein